MSRASAASVLRNVNSRRPRLAGLLLASVCGAAVAAPAPGWAQSAEIQEVIVTARKRQESILNVPVVVTALSQDRLEKLQTSNLSDVARLVPGLVLGTGTATSGVQVALRGVGNNTNDPGVDQSVSLFIDGVQFAQGMAYAAGMFDVGQVEVLKGPQALFFGKSSPGGVISLRSADPTSQVEVIGRLGYEAEARERRAELILSGPVTDTLKLRFAALARKSDGFYYNHATATPGLGGVTPRDIRTNPEQSFILRGTALWTPTDKFTARLKTNSYRTRLIKGGLAQFTSCPDGTAGPFGIPFIVGDDCKLDRTIRDVDIDPTAFQETWYGGLPQQKTRIGFHSAELTYDLTPELGLTSLTGYQSQHSNSMVTSTTTAAASVILIQNTFTRKDFTQEFRLNSDFAGPLNFTLGAYYQDGYFRASIHLPTNNRLGLPLPPTIVRGYNRVFINSYSVFGQARYAVTPKLEVAAGARWTDETRRVKSFNQITGSTVAVPLAVDRIHSKRVSPELTLTYKPEDNVTIFAALKRGYKSGNFIAGAVPAPGGDFSYGDEKVEGGEVGVKSRLLDRRLSLELAAYNYKYTDLQLGTTITNAQGIPVATTINAGSARTYGLDFAASYRPPQVDGLTLDLNGQWNRGKFLTFNNVDCWFGQMISEGCNQTLVNGRFIHQELSGTPLLRAPRWQVNAGFEYERPIGEGMTVVLANNNNYSSKFVTFFGTRPDFFQKGYIKSDLSLALRGRDDRWEVAVIGKNITNKITGSNCSGYNAANGAILGGDATGTNTRGPAGVAEVGCRLDAGREVWLRFTYKPIG